VATIRLAENMGEFNNSADIRSGQSRVVQDRTIHDILPTNESLHRIKISPTDGCKECDKKDNLIHRLAECGGQPMWE